MNGKKEPLASLLALIALVLVAVSAQARPLLLEDARVVTTDALLSRRTNAAQSATDGSGKSPPSEKLVNAGLAGTIPVPSNGSMPPDTQSGASVFPMGGGGDDKYTSQPALSDSSLPAAVSNQSALPNVDNNGQTMQSPSSSISLDPSAGADPSAKTNQSGVALSDDDLSKGAQSQTSPLSDANVGSPAATSASGSKNAASLDDSVVGNATMPPPSIPMSAQLQNSSASESPTGDANLGQEATLAPIDSPLQGNAGSSSQDQKSNLPMDGSPAETATHGADGAPYGPTNTTGLDDTIDGSAKSADGAISNSTFGLEKETLAADAFAGNVTDAAVHPFLAETDTIFSTDSDREYGPSPYESRYRALDDTTGSFDVLKRWGSLAPYFTNPMYPSLQQQKSLPNHCQIKQVHMLHRPGARMPLDTPDEVAHQFEAWHSNATASSSEAAKFEGPLSFLNAWKYSLGTNGLTRAGFQQMYDSGIHSYYRYGGLFNESTEPHKIVMRTTSLRRMADSAEAWAVGFFGFKGASKAATLEVEIEGLGMNSVSTQQ